jgi:hypothetical protein
MPDPILTLLDGGADATPLCGEDVLDRLAPTIIECLPRLESEDPWRPALEQFVRAAPCAQGRRRDAEGR